MFIPSIDAHDTSYFMSRYIWNPEDDHVNGGSDFDDMTETCSSGSYTYSNAQSEDVSISQFPHGLEDQNAEFPVKASSDDCSFLCQSGR